MSVSVGTAYLDVVPRAAKGFAGKLQSEVSGDVTKSGQAAGKSYSSGVVKGASKLAAGLGALFAVDKVKDFLGSSIDEARESQKVSALTTQVIKSTGGAANVSAKQVGNLATAISNKVGVDDEAIQSGENLLLTFKNVRNETGKGNDIFTQASKTSVDLAAALAAANGGQMNLKTSTTLLGKALNDPVKGLSALSRVGVTFTAQQQKQIKSLVASGDSMKAQKIILGELRSEFGGAAASQATAGQKAGVAWKNLQEQIGGLILPLLDKAETYISTKAIPAVSAFFTEFQKGAGTGGKVRDVLQTTLHVLMAIGGFLLDHKKLVVAVVAAWALWRAAVVAKNIVDAISLVNLKLHTEGTLENTVVTKAAAVASKVWAAGQWLLNAALDANPIGLIVIAIAAFVAAVIIAYKKSDTFRAIVQAAFGKVQQIASAVFGWIKKHWPLIFAVLTGPIGLAVLAIVKNWDRIKDGAQSVVSFIAGIPGKIRALVGRFADAGRAIIGGFVNGLKKAGGVVSGIAGSVWDTLKGLLDGAIDKINSALEFKISVGFGKHVSINPPDIPHLAAGGIVKASPGGTLALLGEGGRDEAVIPLAAAGGAGRGRTRAVIVLDDGRELGAYIDDRLDAHRSLGR